MSEDLEVSKSQDEHQQSWWCRIHLRTKIGIGFSALYLLGIYVVASYKHADFAALKLNELGDFLAGVFAPLALLWLVIGYFQQGDELRQNSEALLLQAKELNQAAEHAGGMLEVARQEHELTIKTLNAEHQDRIERETQAREAEEKARKKRIQPIFGFDSAEFHIDRAEVDMKNHGQRCSDFSISIPSNELIELYEPVHDENMGAKREIIIPIKLLARHGRGEVPVILEWTDLDGERMEASYIAVINRNHIDIQKEHR